MTHWIKELGAGFVIGAANIIPGVSGGTLMLVLGIYRRVMSSLSNLKANIIPQLFQNSTKAILSKNRKPHLEALKETCKNIDGFFMIRLMAGAVFAILVLSDLMKHLLSTHFSNTYAFFFGLIMVSAIFSVRYIKRKKIRHIAPLAAGLLLTIAIAVSVDPSESTQSKSDHYKAQYELNVQSDLSSPATQRESGRFQYVGHYSLSNFSTSGLVGALSASAMILPGLSGSLVLILTGQYYEVISAISGLRTFQLDYFFYLCVFAVGILLGILFFAKTVTYVFNRYYDGTMSFLIGLMAGSLFTLWPFKETIVIDQYVKTPEGISLISDTTVHTNINILPATNAEALWALVFFFAGLSTMLLLTRLDKKKTTPDCG
ncbi:membrane protein [Chitinispirillum alkaliphilum]|nr:membrane protein [Chitinispirillum alkaliphilum]